MSFPFSRKRVSLEDTLILFPIGINPLSTTFDHISRTIGPDLEHGKAAYNQGMPDLSQFQEIERFAVVEKVEKPLVQ